MHVLTIKGDMSMNANVSAKLQLICIIRYRNNSINTSGLCRYILYSIQRDVTQLSLSPLILC